MLVAALAAAAWGTFVTLRISNRPPQWPVGQVWTNQEQGTTFRVVKVENLESVKVGESTIEKPPAGAVIQQWQIKVTGIAQADKEHGGVVFCSFQLIGKDKALWTNDVTLAPDGANPTCAAEDYPASGEGILIQSFVVPKNRLDDVLGIQLDSSMRIKQPPLLRAP